MIVKEQAWFVYTFPFPLIHGSQQCAKTVQKKGKENGVTLGKKELVNGQRLDTTYWLKDTNRGFNND